VTLHYHGTPITPTPILESLVGRCFCVSYAAPGQVARCHRLGQSVMLDNGAFTFWNQGVTTDGDYWAQYAVWVEPWLDRPTTWAVIPDVIDGDEADNDLLISKWPRSLFKQSAPVWHMHESLDRLAYLTLAWDKVCVGSSAQYAQVGTSQWHHRMEAAFNRVAPNGKPPWLHMLRGMALTDGPYPFASVDSTDVARNHYLPRNGDAPKMATRWDGKQTPAQWVPREQLALADDGHAVDCDLDDDCVCDLGAYEYAKQQAEGR
jgi:hypothetical protein